MISISPSLGGSRIPMFLSHSSTKVGKVGASMRHGKNSGKEPEDPGLRLVPARDTKRWNFPGAFVSPCLH